ncbi:hypothetical protein Q6D67_18630 [Haliea sp. E1-2-M8]|uniref:hypothetical protein n=1 Tax=Haliea sp. E1-2-M8 TaxID=3064706 RepID=UPI00271EEC29|nr:hypothetical protein [Haliea sp. E1-2-M8]MDO8863712.1 hypothetical protein [Haliea sp. E1-2-M8]
MKRTFLIGALISVIAGCASNPDKIDAAYVSPTKYKNHDCDQIATEMQHVERRTNDLYQRLKSERKADNWQMGIGLVLFWPSLFFLEGGDGPEAAEYAQLQGDHEALRLNSVEKKCGISSRSPEEIMKDAESGTYRADAGENIYQPQHTKQVKEIAEAMTCEESASLLGVVDDTETWLLGCGDEGSMKVKCVENTCYVVQP